MPTGPGVCVGPLCQAPEGADLREYTILRTPAAPENGLRRRLTFAGCEHLTDLGPFVRSSSNG